MTREELDKALALYNCLDEIKRKQEKLKKAEEYDGVRWELLIDPFDCLENLSIPLNGDEVRIITSGLTLYYQQMAEALTHQIEAL